MARGASGISGFVYGISVNVKHTFLRRKKKKRINGKRNLKEREKRRETVTPACSQNAPEFYQSSLQAFIVVQDKRHFQAIGATARGRGETGQTEN